MTSPISARRARRTRGQWSQLVREQAASSVSQQAFCRQHDLGLSTFIKWKRQFNGVSPSSVKPVGFVELPVGGSVSQPVHERTACAAGRGAASSRSYRSACAIRISAGQRLLM